MAGSIVIGLVGIYYKREELKAVFGEKKPPVPGPEPQTTHAPQPKSLRLMD